jgi:hypothetical protein
MHINESLSLLIIELGKHSPFDQLYLSELMDDNTLSSIKQYFGKQWRKQLGNLFNIEISRSNHLYNFTFKDNSIELLKTYLEGTGNASSNLRRVTFGPNDLDQTTRPEQLFQTTRSSTRLSTLILL